MKHRIAVKREQELTLIWRRRLMNLWVVGSRYVRKWTDTCRSTTLLNIVLPVFTMAVTFFVYTVIEGKQLTAATGESLVSDCRVTLILEVFSSMTAFELLKGLMGMVSTAVSHHGLM